MSALTESESRLVAAVGAVLEWCINNDDDAAARRITDAITSALEAL